jgi:hypothetical protein
MRMTAEQYAAYIARQEAAAQRGNQLLKVASPDVYIEVPKSLEEKPAKPRKKIAHHEEELQKSLLEWAQYVSVGPWQLAEMLVHVPNGGYRTKVEAAQLQAMGVKAGYPDVLLDIPAGEYHGARWELKHGKNTLTDSQKKRHVMLRTCGYYVNTYWHWEECAQDIVRYLAQSAYTVIERAKVPA